MNNRYVKFSEEVKDALQNGKAILALESTVITHGMPYPDNYKTAIELEDICRSQGVVPATILFYHGIIHVGCDKTLLDQIAQESNCEKISVRDIAYCIACKKSGGTTVAATSKIAEMVGIDVFSTGGIGGVHRDANLTHDVSADLVSLKETNVIVVSAGVKAILDIPATLEVLESYNVQVFAFQTDNFPAFYSCSSGCKVRKAESITTIVDSWKVQKELGLKEGMLVGNPIDTKYEIPAEVIEPFIKHALQDADKLGIKGKDITPYLLNRLYEITEGKSLTTNIELIKNNVILGCKIARELKKKDF